MKYICVVGSHENGFHFVGPFEDDDAAFRFTGHCDDYETVPLLTVEEWRIECGK